MIVPGVVAFAPPCICPHFHISWTVVRSGSPWALRPGQGPARARLKGGSELMGQWIFCWYLPWGTQVSMCPNSPLHTSPDFILTPIWPNFCPHRPIQNQIQRGVRSAHLLSWSCSSTRNSGRSPVKWRLRTGWLGQVFCNVQPLFLHQWSRSPLWQFIGIGLWLVFSSGSTGCSWDSRHRGGLKRLKKHQGEPQKCTVGSQPQARLDSVWVSLPKSCSSCHLEDWPVCVSRLLSSWRDFLTESRTLQPQELPECVFLCHCCMSVCVNVILCFCVSMCGV